MNDIVSYATSVPVLLKTTNILLELYDHHEDRILELKLNSMQASMHELSVSAATLSSGIESIAKACSTSIESYNNLKAFKIYAKSTLEEQKARQEFFFSCIKPLVEHCDYFIKNNSILIDTSHLDEIDRNAAVNIRNMYLEMQYKYLKALNNLI